MYRFVWLPLFLFTLLCTLVFMETCPGCPGLPFSTAFELSRHIRTCGNFHALEYVSERGVACGGGDDGGGGGGGGCGPMDTSQDLGYCSGGDGPGGENFDAPHGIAYAAAGGGGGGGDAAPYPLVHDGEAGEAAVVELLAALGRAPHDDSDGDESVGPVPFAPLFGAADGGGGAAAAAPVLPSATLRAGSAESADFNTLAWLMKPGISASVQLYGMLQKVRLSFPPHQCACAPPPPPPPSSPLAPPLSPELRAARRVWKRL